MGGVWPESSLAWNIDSDLAGVAGTEGSIPRTPLPQAARPKLTPDAIVTCSLLALLCGDHKGHDADDDSNDDGDDGMSTAQRPASASAAAPNLRKRRFPYTQVACDECQRRKRKCSGERPCKGCRDSNAICLFERNTRFRSGSRRQSNEGSKTALNKVRTARRPSDTAPSVPVAPGSSEYYLKLAGRFLASSRPQPEGAAEAVVESTTVDIHSLQRLTDHHRAGDPADIFGLLSETQWAGILQSYQEECGLQYPCLDLDELKYEIRTASRGKAGPNPQSGTRSRSDASMQKQRLGDIALLIAAIVSTLADPKAIEVADSTVDEIHAAALVKTHLSSIDLDDLTLLILTSIYFFLSDREQQAWRAIGMVMRLLQELGYHSSRGSSPAGEQLDDRGERLFWTVYTLDHRWSFGTGLPFGIQDSDIDHNPTFADNSISSAYVKHMVAYCRIASEVRKSIQEQSASTQGISDSTRDLLDFRIVEWRRNLPGRLQFRGVDDKFDPEHENRGHYRIRLTLYLRGNQMRTIIHRKASVRPGSSNLDPSNANIMAQVAQDTIRVLVNLARDTDIYRAQHRTFNHFLQTALSSLLLAMCCTDDVDMDTCLRDAHEAMDLVKQLSNESPITRRLLDKLQYVQDTLNNFRPHHTDAGSQKYPRPSRQAKAKIAQPSGYPDGPEGQVGLRDQSNATGQSNMMPIAALTSPPNGLPSPSMPRASFGGDAFAGVSPYAPTPSTSSDSFASAQPTFPLGLPQGLEFPDSAQYASGYLTLMRFPELGEILNDYENNFTF
ncbi:fungal specific transcription factor [Purpureocillium lavendulum]|uniref:Fungal specific transcription factor n=1 Tax=Purpureocillium lavendulum TaxID=1247861 RepID=A0AB34FVK6_9HYPO|nr:fungal specific transcription factor [Purpureocillium lavendulum]